MPLVYRLQVRRAESSPPAEREPIPPLVCYPQRMRTASLALLFLIAAALLSACSTDPTPTLTPTATSPSPTPVMADTPTPVRAVPHIPIPTREPTPTPNVQPTLPTLTPTPSTSGEARALLASGAAALSEAKGAAFQIDATLQAGNENFSINYSGDFAVIQYVSTIATVTTPEGNVFKSRIISGFHEFYFFNETTREWESSDYRDAPFVTNIGALFGWRWDMLTGLSLGDRKTIEGVESQAVSGRLDSLKFSGHRGDFEATYWFGVEDNHLRKVSLSGIIQLDEEYSIVGVDAPPGAQLSLELTARVFDHGKSVPVLTPDPYFPVYSGHKGILLDDGRVLMAGGFTGFVANNNLIIPSPVGPVQIYNPSTEEWALLEPIEGPGLLYSIVELADKKILMVGMRSDEEGEVVPMASLFDAASDSWTAAPRPTALRAQPNLLLLQDGRVLMTGGWAVTDNDAMFFADPENLNSSEIFEPSTGLWTQAAPTHKVMEGQRLSLLEDGRVLAIGTAWDTYDPTSHAEVYDPATDEWSVLESLDPHYVPTNVVRLADGRLLVTGDYTATDNASIVHRAAGVVTLQLPDGALLTFEYDDTGIQSVQLPDGTRISNADFGARFFGAKLYDPSTDLWAPAGMTAPAGLMIHPREAATLTLLPDGRVLAAGGVKVDLPWRFFRTQDPSSEDPTLISFTEIFDPVTGLWSLGPELSEPRVDHSATALPDGRVLIAGGIGLTRTENPEIYPLAASEVIDPNP